MTDLIVAVASAFWLGILTTVSPCPLATNIAAVSYVGRNVTSSWRVFLSGLLYTLGRTAVYVIIGVILVKSLLAAVNLSFFLQNNVNKILGPILIVVGMVLVGLINFNVSGFGQSKRLERWVEALGLGGAFLLGAVFALSFCPVSAALFFGSLIPIALASGSDLIVPSAYGVATGLPVLVFAVLLAVGVKQMTPIFNKIVRYELWIRRLTGVVFILVGIYYCLVYIFRIYG
jgi:cytochrome c-type biogenesis protein